MVIFNSYVELSEATSHSRILWKSVKIMFQYKPCVVSSTQSQVRKTGLHGMTDKFHPGFYGHPGHCSFIFQATRYGQQHPQSKRATSPSNHEETGDQRNIWARYTQSMYTCMSIDTYTLCLLMKICMCIYKCIMHMYIIYTYNIHHMHYIQLYI